jgi:hypothetical protein
MGTKFIFVGGGELERVARLPWRERVKHSEPLPFATRDIYTAPTGFIPTLPGAMSL